MDKVFVENVELEMPEELLDDFQVFKSVINEETWKDILSEEEKLYLFNFLPRFDANDAEEKEKTLKLLFSGANFSFGNPLKLFHENLKDGMYNPTVSKLKSACHSLKEKQDIYAMELYYEKLLCDAVVGKQKILDRLYKTSASHNKQSREHLYSKETDCQLKQSIHYRVNERCFEYLKELKGEAGDVDITSSDDDDGDDRYQYEKIPYFKHLVSGDTSLTAKVSLDKEGVSSKPTQANETSLTNDDFVSMMKKHKKRKRSNPKLPEFDTSGLSLEDVMSRADFSKKPKLSAGASKSKKGKQEVGEPVADAVISRVKTEPDDANLGSKVEIKVEKTDSFIPENLGPFQSFFSLIKEFVCAEQGRGTLLHRLEDKVAEWQQCSLVGNSNAWLIEYSSWSELVLPALKFLSGEMGGIQLEEFDPPVHCKENIWTWRTESTCDDDELSCLYYLWMEQRNNLELNNSVVDLSAPVPAPRMYTDYIVQSSSPEEKEFFRVQEMKRFSNPHKAFTYRLHGYESVVGPIKGVYNKESSAVKAREHALLVNERPACVNILTLVHDSAARLPNGEGTRNDICELLKDSQFLGPGVTDAQINTIVSGALDRLHYERDPCVKYDNARKVWIYRHRHRTEAEFERIHQIQRTAVKAKKLSCPKKGSLSKLQLSILKQKESNKQHGRNSSQPVPSTKLSVSSSSQNATISSPPKFVKAPVVVSQSPLPPTMPNTTTLRHPQQHIHTVLQLPDGSIIKANPAAKTGMPLMTTLMTKISASSIGEKTYSLLANRNLGLKTASNTGQESIVTTQMNLQSLTSTITSPLKTDVNQLRLISQIQQQLLHHQKQQSTSVRPSLGNLTSASILRPGIQCSTTVASLISNQKISGLVANSNIITSKTGAIANNYVSHLLRGSTLVLPSSTSGQSSSNIQSLICVTIANSNLAQLNQSGLIRSQSNASNVRVLSLPTKVLIPEQQHPQKNILIGQPVSQTLVNPPAIYLANLHGKPIQDSIKSLPTSSIINTSNISLTKSLNTVPRGINPSISLLSPTDVRVAIMRPKAGQDHSPQVLQARLPTSLQGFFQIVSRPQLPTQTTTSK